MKNQLLSIVIKAIITKKNVRWF